MKKLCLVIILALFINVNGQQTTDNSSEPSAISYQQSVNTGIIPTPQFAEICDFNNSTNNFVIDESCLLVDIGENEEISKIINTFKNDIKEITGVDLKVSKKGNKKRNNIVFGIYDPEIIEQIQPKDIIGLDSIEIKINPQEYHIIVIGNYIMVSAPTPQGLFYGAQSLKQIIRHQLLTENNLNIPWYYIFDYPSLEYRGWMDDISRGPIPTTEFIKEEIRRLA